MKVLANDGLSPESRKTLTDTGFEVLDNRVAAEHLVKFINEKHVEVLLVKTGTNVDRDLIDDCPGLKIIGCLGKTCDQVDVEYAEEIGLTILKYSKATSRSIAELVFAHFFSIARDLHETNRLMPMEGDVNFEGLQESFSNADELEGKTLGVLGLNPIGIEIIKIGFALNMKILCWDQQAKSEQVELNFQDGQSISFEVKNSEFKEVLSKSDFISLNTDSIPEGILNERSFNLMKEGVCFVNVSDGQMIDETALLQAIEEEKIKGAGLDVFSHEPNPQISLLMHPSLSLSPHTGGLTKDAKLKIEKEVVEQLIKLH